MQDFNSIQTEVQRVIWRNNISVKGWQIKFMVPISTKLREQIASLELPLGPDEYALPCTTILLTLEALFSKSMQGVRTKFWLYLGALFLMCCRFAVLCVVWRVIYFTNMDWSTFFGVNKEQIGLLVAIHFLALISLPVLIEKVIWGTSYDMLRTSFFSSQLLNMLSLQGFSHMAKHQDSINDETRVFPTIDFTSTKSIECWNHLRKRMLDFGRVYEYTGKGAITALAILVSCEVIFSAYNYIVGETNKFILFTLPLPFDFLAVTGYLRLTVGSAASINGAFDGYLRAWVSILGILNDVKSQANAFLSAVMMGSDAELAMLPMALVEICKNHQARGRWGRRRLKR
jgi:hypothetical protein